MPLPVKSILTRFLVVAVALALGFGLNLFGPQTSLDGLLARLGTVFQRSPEQASAPADPARQEPPAQAQPEAALSAPLAVEPAPAAVAETASKTPEVAPAASDTAARDSAEQSAQPQQPATAAELSATPGQPTAETAAPVPDAQGGHASPEAPMAAGLNEPAPAVQEKAPDQPPAKAAQGPPAQKHQTAAGAKEVAGKAAAKEAEGKAVEPSAPKTAVAKSQAEPKIAAEEGSRTGEPGANRILEITAQDGPDGVRITVETRNAPDKVAVHLYKDPARIALDLQGAWTSNVRQSLSVQSETVEKIRLGQHPDMLRLVLDCRVKTGLPPQPVIERQAKGLVIRVPKAKAEALP